MNNKIMKKRRTLAAVLVISLLCMTGCGAANGTPDDVATNDGGSQTESETGSVASAKMTLKSAYYIYRIRQREAVIHIRMIWVSRVCSLISDSRKIR